MGEIRAPLLQSSRKTELAAVVDSNEAAWGPFGERHGVEPASFHATLPDALAAAGRDADGVDAVWVSTPTHTHMGLLEDASQAGLAVFMEKPVAETEDEIREAFRIARARGTPLVCGFQRRLDPTYAELLASVRNGTVGRVQLIHIAFRDHPVPPIEFLKTGGDPFTDLAPHDVDLIRQLVGEEPCEVWATGSAFNPELQEAGVLDTALMVLKFPSGAIATIDMTRSTAYGYDQRAEVFGDRGMLQVGNPTRTALTLTDARGVTVDPPQFSFPERFAASYAREVDHFADVVRGHAAPMVSEADCIRAQAISLAGLRSYQTGTAVRMDAGLGTGRPINVRFAGFGEFGRSQAALVERRAGDAFRVMSRPFRGSSPAGAWERDVIGDSTVDAVYICSPDDQHHAQALQALRAGKHVFVEKPVHDFDEVMAAAVAADRVLQVGFQRRFDAQYIAARDHIAQLRAAGGAGVARVALTSRDPGPGHPDEAFVVTNSLIHDIDAAGWLLPDCTLSVRRMERPSGGAPNAMEVELEARDGSGEVVCTLTLSFAKGSQSYVQQVSVVGGDGASTSFGHDLAWPDLPDGQQYEEAPWVGLYADAQAAQWQQFDRLVREQARSASDTSSAASADGTAAAKAVPASERAALMASYASTMRLAAEVVAAL